MGRVDELRGFKENVILGHLIPAGTGFPLHRYLKLVPLCEPISDEEMEQLEQEKKQRMDELYPMPTGPDEGDDDNEPPFPVQGESTIEAAADAVAAGDESLIEQDGDTYGDEA